MTEQPRRPLWRLILGVLLMAYGALMLAVDVYSALVMGAAGLVGGFGPALIGAVALFIGWRVYRVD